MNTRFMYFRVCSAKLKFNPFFPGLYMGGGKTMNSIRFTGIAILIVAFIVGCSGNYESINNLSESESRVTQQELIDNWSDYDIWLYYNKEGPSPEIVIILFDTKNDNREILVEDYMGMVKVKDQEMWTEVIKENTTSDGDFILTPSWGGGTISVREIRESDNQLYGYIIYNEGWPVYARLAEENTLRLDRRIPNFG